MGNGGSSSSSKGTLTSAYLTSQHGPSFVSSLFSADKDSPTQVLPDGTVLTPTNVAGLYQRYVDECSNTKSRDARKGRDICFKYLLQSFLQVMACSEGRRSFFELSAKALKRVLRDDGLTVSSEFLLYIVVGVWADRLVTLEKGEEWGLPDVPEDDQEAAHDDVDIPDWKLDTEYVEKLRERMAPLLPHIRFPLMSPEQLAAIEEEGRLVPLAYITEAYRHRALIGSDVYAPDTKTNPRLKNRRYNTVVVFDPNWHGQNVTVSSDGKTVNKAQSYWYCLAMATEGYSTGRHAWAVQVNGDEAYVGVARKELNQLDNYLGADTNSWAYNHSGGTSNGYNQSGNLGQTFGRGDVIGMVLDMTDMTLTYYKNGKKLGAGFTNLPKVKLYPAVGWRDGTMSFVPANFDTV